MFSSFDGAENSLNDKTKDLVDHRQFAASTNKNSRPRLCSSAQESFSLNLTLTWQLDIKQVPSPRKHADILTLTQERQDDTQSNLDVQTRARGVMCFLDVVRHRGGVTMLRMMMMMMMMNTASHNDRHRHTGNRKKDVAWVKHFSFCV
jgi:hypothetical protein